MKKFILMLGLGLFSTMIPSNHAKAQGIILDLLKRIIMSADLKIQRIQEETIRLQAVQKEVENAMSKLHLDDITNWVQKQKDLYQQYYTELWEIKNAISSYQRIKDMIEKQAQLVVDYKKAYDVVGKDKHFSQEELKHIYKVYDGILDQSIKNVGQIELVIKSFVTQMPDAERLKVIDEADRRIDINYNDLREYTQQNILISLQRSRGQNEIDIVRWLYGIQ